MTEETQVQFSSSYPVIVLSRPYGQDGVDWQEIDRGPGYFSVPPDYEVRIRIKGIDDDTLLGIVKELEGVEVLHFLDLAENRNITNTGLAHLKLLPQLTGLNLSSCSITDSGMKHLIDLPKLSYLNLGYCNKLSDPALKHLEAIRHPIYVDLRGCLGFTKGGLSRIRRRSLTIYR